jgi:hypothetical protein
MEPVRQAKKFDKGVSVFDMLTPPKCEFNKAPLPNFTLEAAGKPLSFIGHRPHPITKTGHRNPILDTGDGTISTATAVLPLLKNTSSFGLEPMRQGGVCF